MSWERTRDDLWVNRTWHDTCISYDDIIGFRIKANKISPYSPYCHVVDVLIEAYNMSLMNYVDYILSIPRKEKTKLETKCFELDCEYNNTIRAKKFIRRWFNLNNYYHYTTTLYKGFKIASDMNNGDLVLFIISYYVLWECVCTHHKNIIMNIFRRLCKDENYTCAKILADKHTFIRMFLKMKAYRFIKCPLKVSAPNVRHILLLSYGTQQNVFSMIPCDLIRSIAQYLEFLYKN